jgi:hypothetical protein
MVLPVILGAAQAGMGILGGLNQQNEAAGQAAYNTAFQNAMTDSANRRTEQTFGRQLGMVQEQYGYNRDAANRAYAAEQIRLNELFAQAAFQQQGALQNLIETRGINNATERYGRSATRANLVGTLGQFGRNQAVQAISLASAQAQSGRNLDQISRDSFTQNLNAWQQVAIAPTMQSPMPMPQAPSGFNSSLMIGNSLMSGLSTFSALKPPSSGGSGMQSTRSSVSPINSWAYGTGLPRFYS